MVNTGLIYVAQKMIKVYRLLIFRECPSNQCINSIFQLITYVTLYESFHESFRKKVLFCRSFFGSLSVDFYQFLGSFRNFSQNFDVK
jgi:hypothetical protein